MLEAEHNELNGHKNLIPRASIVPKNVVFGAKKGQLAIGESDNKAQEIIEYVWVMSCIGNNCATGSVLERLFAIGQILHYLFSVGVVPMTNEITTAYQEVSTILYIRSENTAGHNSHAQKKLHCREGQVDVSYITSL